MKVLMISFTSLMQELYHAKPRAIAKLPDVQLTVLVPPFWKELWSTKRTDLEIKHDDAYRIEIAPAYFTGNLHLAFFKKMLASLIKELQPDIIDIENETFNAGSAQVVYLRNRFSPHSRIVMHASQSDYKSYPPPFSWFERYSLQHVSAFMARNQNAVDVLRKKGYRKDIEIITHGVDPSKFIWKKNEARSDIGLQDNFTVGYLGVLGEHKGLDTLLRAIPQSQCNAVLIGDGEYKRELERISTELRLEERVKIIPPVPHRDVPKYLAAMDVFVLPSRTKVNWREKFGRVLIEAMAAGVPVIGSNSGEIPHVVGNAGLIFPEGDSMALAEYLNVLMNNPNERKRLSQLGRERVNTLYSWDVIAQKTYGLYQKALQRR